ncbi:MAG: riboflavin synthase [Nitrospirae bacterium]|nr:riboflavin synthase [Nitrospirota bacterium]MBI3594166.1 riboflavin synthase [Nitrospirota bacterium]
MFSGLIAGTGIVKGMAKSGRSARLTIEGRGVLKKLSSGESVSVNGACLTVAALSKSRFTADISNETLARTTLGDLRAGDPVNLEQSARFSDRIGGHLVSGHIDGIGRIRKIEQIENAFLYQIDLPKSLLKYCIEKGSIAVEGISLTINQVKEKGILLMVIPHTMELTNLGEKKAGDRVNIENDLVGKYIERFLQYK